MYSTSDKTSGERKKSRCTRTAAFRCPHKVNAWELCRYMVCKECNLGKKPTVSRKGVKRLITTLKEGNQEQERALNTTHISKSSKRHHKKSQMPKGNPLMSPKVAEIGNKTIKQFHHGTEPSNPPSNSKVYTIWMTGCKITILWLTNAINIQ